MYRAACRVPGPPHYGREDIIAGLRAAGCDLLDEPADDPGPGDVLVIWNRRIVDEHIAARYEHAGARVIVVENGYLGADEKPPRYYAVATGHHLGAGDWPVGGEDRWSRMGFELKPWRKDGRHILVLPQRSIGEYGVAMPERWADTVVDRLRGVTDRPIRVRRHPGKRPHPPMDDDLADCWAAVTWGSGAGVKAIIAGVPVFHDLPRWIGGLAAKRGVEAIDEPFVGCRLPMLHRLAWGQWTADEIRTGEPFARLLA